MASATDTFTRADEATLAGDWETINHNGLALASNQVRGKNDGQDNVSAWKATSTAFAANHWSQAVMATLNADDDTGLAVRCSTGGNGYQLICIRSADLLACRKMTSGTTDVIGAAAAWATRTGDTVRFEASGTSTTTLKVYVNGSLAGTWTDSSSPHTTGQPGLYYYWGNNGSSYIDTWEAGDDAGGSTTYPQSRPPRTVGFTNGFGITRF